MDTNTITFLACICFLFIFGRLFIIPLKKILKIILNSCIGAGFIYVVNIIGANFGFHIGLNFFTTVLIRDIRFTRCCTAYISKTYSSDKIIRILTSLYM